MQLEYSRAGLAAFPDGLRVLREWEGSFQPNTPLVDALLPLFDQ